MTGHKTRLTQLARQIAADADTALAGARALAEDTDPGTDLHLLALTLAGGSRRLAQLAARVAVEAGHAPDARAREIRDAAPSQGDTR